MTDFMNTFCLHTSSEDETRCLGRQLGALLFPGMTVLLDGDLGTGKTVFVRGVGEALNVGRVRSPSFTLVNEYQTDTLCVVHADLYRLEPEEVGDLALEDYPGEGCVLFVEWPERWKNPPKSDVLEIKFTMNGEAGRVLAVSARGAKAERVAESLRFSAAKEREE